MLQKTKERKIYLRQIKYKACAICIYVDEYVNESKDSTICAACLYYDDKPKWKNTHE